MNAQLARRVAVDVLAIAAALAIVGYYMHYLYSEELREWRSLEVVFPEVGGLRVGDDVQVRGARVGRVRAIRLFEDRQLVRLEVEPDLELYSHGIGIEIVPVNALGGVAVVVEPGDPTSRPLDPGVRLRGEVRRGLGGAPEPAYGRREELRLSVQDLAAQTGALLDPTSGFLGYAFSDPGGVVVMKEQLEQLERLWSDMDAQLAEVEHGQDTSALLSADSLVAASDFAAALRATLVGIREGLATAARGEGGAGPFVADRSFGADWRQTLLAQETFWDESAAGEGMLGRLVNSETDLAGLQRALDRLEEVTEEGVRGEGLLGALSTAEAGEAARRALAGLEADLAGLREGPLVSGAAAQQQRDRVWDGVANVEDALIDVKRGLRSIRADTPDRTFQGALFGIF